MKKTILLLLLVMLFPIGYASVDWDLVSCELTAQNYINISYNGNNIANLSIFFQSDSIPKTNIYNINDFQSKKAIIEKNFKNCKFGFNVTLGNLNPPTISAINNNPRFIYDFSYVDKTDFFRQFKFTDFIKDSYCYDSSNPSSKYNFKYQIDNSIDFDIIQIYNHSNINNFWTCESDPSMTIRSDLTVGLVSCWSLDSDASDSYGNNDGTVTNANLLTTGCKLGSGCYNFSDTSYIDIPDNETLRFYTNDFTIVLWAKINNNTNEDYNYFMGKGDTGSDEWMLRVNTNPVTDYEWYGGAGVHNVGQFVIPNASNWNMYHVNRTTNVLNIGHNLTWDSGPDSSIVNYSTTKSLRFGDADNSATRNFEGQLDEIMIWNRSLNETEMQDIYNYGIGVNCSDLISSGVVSNTSNGTEPFSFSSIAPDKNFTNNQSAHLNFTILGNSTNWTLYFNESGSWKAIFNATNITTNYFNHTGLNNNTVYQYYANVTWNSTIQNTTGLFFITTLQNPPPAITQTPTPQNLLNASQTNESIYFNWTELSQAEYFLIYENGVNTHNTSGNVNFYNLTLLSNNTEYCVNITAYNSTYNLAESNVSNTICTVTYQNIVPPPSVTIDSFTCSAVSNTSVALNWTISGDYNYSLLYNYSGSSETLLLNSSVFGYLHTGLLPDTNTDYNLTAFYNSSIYDISTVTCKPNANTAETTTTTTTTVTGGMDFGDMLYLLSFIIFFSLSIIKVYNVMNSGQIYDLGKGIIIYVGILITWGLNLFTFLINNTDSLYRILFAIMSLFLTLNTILLIIEIFFNLEKTVDPRRERRNTMQLYKP